MNNQIQKADAELSREVKHFKVHKGSNYKVVMKYGREEVISWEHFQSLSRKIFTDGAKFTTVNDTIVQVDDIRMIEPTKERTAQQKAEIEKKKKEEQRKEKYKQELQRHYSNFEKKYFDAKYGDGDWRLYSIPKMMEAKEKDKRVVVAPDERKKVWDRYEEQHNDKAKKLEELQGERV